MLSNKDIRVENENLIINGEKNPIVQDVSEIEGDIETLDDRTTVLEISKLNKTAIQTGREAFPPAEIGLQTIIVTFPQPFENIPSVIASWDDSPTLASYFKFPLLILDVTKTTFTIRAERLNANSNWFFRYIAVDKQ